MHEEHTAYCRFTDRPADEPVLHGERCGFRFSTRDSGRGRVQCAKAEDFTSPQIPCTHASSPRVPPRPSTSTARNICRTAAKMHFFSLARSLARRRGAAPLLSVAALRRWRKRQKTVHATLKSKRVVPAQTATQRVSRLPLSPGAGHHKVPTSELSASAIFRRSSKQRDECLSPMRADEI